MFLVCGGESKDKRSGLLSVGNVEIFLRLSARRLALCFLSVSLDKRTSISKDEEKEIIKNYPKVWFMYS